MNKKRVTHPHGQATQVNAKFLSLWTTAAAVINNKQHYKQIESL